MKYRQIVSEQGKILIVSLQVHGKRSSRQNCKAKKANNSKHIVSVISTRQKHEPRVGRQYLGLDSLANRGDGAFLVIAHKVSAVLACTSGELWKV